MEEGVEEGVGGSGGGSGGGRRGGGKEEGEGDWKKEERREGEGKHTVSNVWACTQGKSCPPHPDVILSDIANVHLPPGFHM